MEEFRGRIFNKEEKQKILNYTLDNLGQAAMKGLLIGGFFRIVFRSRTLALFSFGYMLGMSLRDSNTYILNNFKIGDSVGKSTL